MPRKSLCGLDLQSPMVRSFTDSSGGEDFSLNSRTKQSADREPAPAGKSACPELRNQDDFAVGAGRLHDIDMGLRGVL